MGKKAGDSLAMEGMEKWPQGRYKIKVESKDENGETVHNHAYFVVMDATNEELTVPEPLWVHVEQSTLEPGETADIWVGSGFEDAWVLFEVEIGWKIVKKQWIRLSKEKQRIQIPIAEKHRGNFAVYATLVRHGAVFKEIKQITVPWSNKQLKIAVGTFRDKLEPGDKENWDLVVSGPKGERVMAEALSTMYDASLDAIAPNYWGLYPFSSRSATMGWSQQDGFGVAVLVVNADNWNAYSDIVFKTYSYPDFFGFNDLTAPEYGLDFGTSILNLGYMNRGGATFAWDFGDQTVVNAAATGSYTLSVTDANGTSSVDFLQQRPQSQFSSYRAEQEQNKSGFVRGRGKSTQSRPTQIRKRLGETAFFYPHLRTD
ncbi:MAG: hypothetical protein AAF570_24705, partial [Bacteroidota bacterium]